MTATKLPDDLEKLVAQGVLMVTPQRAAEILATSQRTLARYAEKNPEKLTKVPWGTNRIRYRLEQLVELAKTGLI